MTDAPTALAITPSRDRMVAVLMLALWAAVTILQQWNQWAEDLSAVYLAGWLWQHGQEALIYDAPPAFFGGVADSWLPAMETLGIAQKTSYAYVYPPIWAALLAPVTDWLSPQGFANMATLLQVPLLAVSVWLAGRLIKPDTMPWWLWSGIGIVTLSLTIQPVLAIWHNQPTITVGFLILLAFDRLEAGRPVAAGALLALAAAIKLTPAAFALIFLLDRQYRAIASFAVLGGALGLLSIALAGWPAHAAFLDSIALVKGVSFLSKFNTSLMPAFLAVGSLAGWLSMPDKELAQVIYQSFPAWVSPAISFAALVLILTFGRALAPLAGRSRRTIALFALSVILPLFGPLGWLHYYILPMLLLPGLFGLLPSRTASLLIALVGIPSLTFVFGQSGALPWPIANYTWAMCAAWGAILVGLYAAALRAAR